MGEAMLAPSLSGVRVLLSKGIRWWARRAGDTASDPKPRRAAGDVLARMACGEEWLVAGLKSQWSCASYCRRFSAFASTSEASESRMNSADSSAGPHTAAWSARLRRERESALSGCKASDRRR